MRWKGSFNMRSVKWLGSIAAVLFSFLGWNNALAQEKVETKEAVKARPKGTQKQNEGGPYREAAKPLFAPQTFDQAAISPDGQKVALMKKDAATARAPTRNRDNRCRATEAETAP